MSGNVGYLDLRTFVDLNLSKDTAVAAMNFLANTDAVNAGQATVSFVYDEGARHVKKVPLQPNSRTTIDAGTFESAVDRKFSVIVESDGVPIVVERSLYHTVGGVL